MLAERSVRRLSIRAPDDGLARRAGLLIEDALRTASLPGDGAALVLVRRLRLPPFRAGASAQQVALRLEAQCRGAAVVEGAGADEATLATAAAVRFAGALEAHLALTRLILAGSAPRAWCWPLAVKGYRPALGTGPALRAVAMSLATLAEAPVALPRWMAHLLVHGTGPCTALLLALEVHDMALLEDAVCHAPRRSMPPASGHWRAALAWSGGYLGPTDRRHRWLLGIAQLCGVQSGRPVREAPVDGEGDSLRADAPGLAAPRAGVANDAREHFLTARAADCAVGPGEPAARAAPELAPGQMPAGPATVRETGPAGAVRAFTTQAASDMAPAEARAPGLEAPIEAEPNESVTGMPTAAGGLLFIVPVLARLGLAETLDVTSAELPLRIFTRLLRRLPVAADDPAWLLCELPLAGDDDGERDSARWLGACRRHLRLKVGIGLYTLVCRPATITITATHVELRQSLDAIDLRVRRSGLDIDPGWVPWLGRVVRFHYGQSSS